MSHYIKTARSSTQWQFRAGAVSWYAFGGWTAAALLLLSSAHGERHVTFQQMAPLFDGGSAKCARETFTQRIHDARKGCLCCVTVDVKSGADSCSYTVQAVYVFYSSASRNEVNKSMSRFLTMLRPADGTLVDTLQVGPSEIVYTYGVGNIRCELTSAVYHHQDVWAGSLTVISYELP